MGPVAVIELIKQMRAIIEKRDMQWKSRSTIMIDVFMNRERHILCRNLATIDDEIPNVREFGP
jgi:hypothetical protein